MTAQLCPDCGRSDCPSLLIRHTMTRRSVLRAAGVGAFGAATAFVLAACTSGGGSASTSSASAGAVKAGTGTATMAIFGSIGPCLMPNLTNNGNARAVTQCFGSSLLAYDEKMDFIPSLASKYTVSSDGTQYTFDLRKGVKWSDGTPFTADDIEAAITAMTDPQTTTNWITYVSPIAGTSDRKAGKSATIGYKKVDDTTFTVTLSAPNASFLDLFGTQFQPLPAHIVSKIAPTDLNTGTFAQAPNVTIGPFYMTSRSGDDDMEMARNPHFWGGTVGLAKLVVKSMTETNGVTAILAGEVDVIPAESVAEIAPSDVETLSSNSAIKVVKYQNSTCQTLYMNEHTLFSDKRVRQAVIYALDRKGMIKTVLDGDGIVADSVYPPFSKYYDAKVITKYTQNVKKAKQLLSDAGWDASKTVNFIVPTGDTTVTQASVIIQQQLKTIGMNVQIQQVDNNTAISRANQQHNFDLTILANVGVNNLDVSRRFSTAAWKTGVNSGGYSNPQLDQLMAQAVTKSAFSDQKPLTDQIQQLISQEVPTVMLWYRDSIAAVDTAKVTNVVPQRGGAWLQAAKWGSA
ncbi:ABC transporter substrate-binding protein [Gryllotalpicola reticulitermitis]|uniref:ABC transporter substrate-binding protein n=1 Tax=Gryllotalpicola reticulitermitis TaxID=1184153 RepID=A0ABV8Q660_9MICO